MSNIHYGVNSSNWQTEVTFYILRYSETSTIYPYYNSVRVLSNRPSDCYDAINWGITPDEYATWTSLDGKITYHAYGYGSRIFNNFGTIDIPMRHTYFNTSSSNYIEEYGATIHIVVQGYCRARLRLISDGVTWQEWIEQTLVTSAGNHNMTSYLPTDIPTKAGYTFVGWEIPDSHGTILPPGNVLIFYGNTEYMPEFNYVAVWKQDNNTNSYVKTGGSWVKTKKLYVKQSGSWKEVKSLYGKTGGAWKKSQ